MSGNIEKDQKVHGARLYGEPRGVVRAAINSYGKEMPKKVKAFLRVSHAGFKFDLVIYPSIALRS